MLITEEYREQQKYLHANYNYGVVSIEFAPIVSELINRTGLNDILDYGAGRGNLAKHLTPAHSVSVTHYEPAREEWADDPEPHDLVCCIDVLEHIEPELLDNVLDDLARLTKKVGFFTVHTGPAGKILPDGRNAHLIQEPAAWWLPKILERFQLNSFAARKTGFYVVCTPLE